MRLTPTERDRLLLFSAAELARSRRARGLRLNVPEATALVADAVCEAARAGARVADAARVGREVLGQEDVLPGVADVLTEVSVEAVFDDGTRLVVISDPIGGGSSGDSAPGAVLATDDRPPIRSDEITLTVTNTASVPISVTSHFHFFEVNPRLRFDRGAAFGRRAAIPAGATIRFEPGRAHEVTLVPIGGERVIIGFAGLVDGPLDAPGRREEAHAGPGCGDISTAKRTAMTLSGHEYAATYGPRRGDRIRLADSNLLIEVAHDSSQPGDEFLAGFGKTARDGLHLRAAAVRDTCDLVISNVVIVDAVTGIRKASIGVRSGRIAAIGRAGNPDTLADVDVVVGTGTSIVSGEGLIATAGAIDTHVHLLSPRIMEASLASGVTTIIGQEFGPVWGVGVNSPWALRHAFNAFDAWPVNIGFLARGSSSGPAPLIEALVEGGASGFKVHEDMGAHARALDTALRVAEAHDVQVALHTDSLNESLSVEDTLAVLDGRTIHAFHIEGCGGGHVPNVLRLAGEPNVICSSTNPTLPFGRDTLAEHFDMIVSVHGLKPDLPGEVAIVRDRIREGTMGAENVLHDLGVIAITSSDAQGMGRAGETIRRTFAMAAKMKADLGSGPATHDNDRVLRYVAKLTINPAIAHGLADEIGSIEVGKLADIVLWKPAYFAAKPDLVIKAGFPAYGVTGDPNASTDRCEPLVLGPQFGAYGATAADLSVAFVASAALQAESDSMTTRRRRVAVHGTRSIGPRSMIRNRRLGEVRVAPESGRVTLDGTPIGVRPADTVSFNRLYFL